MPQMFSYIVFLTFFSALHATEENSDALPSFNQKIFLTELNNLKNLQQNETVQPNVPEYILSFNQKSAMTEKKLSR